MSTDSNAKPNKIIFWTAVVILLLAFTAQRLTSDRFWLALLDNVHWTTATAGAAALAWLGFVESSGAERAARRWFFVGLSAYATGQLLWDFQAYIGWNPFPAPSDLFYLMLGPFCLAGLAVLLRSLLPGHNQRVFALDTALLSIAVLTLVLVIYLPKSDAVSLLTLCVMTAYPVFLLTAACFGFLMILHLRPQPGWSWILFQVGLGLQGIVWMWWNAQALSGTTVDGSFLNEMFSVAVMILGVAAMRWRIMLSGNIRYAIWCEGVLRMLPLLAVVLAAMASVLVLSLNDIQPVLKEVVLFASIAVLVLSALRQSLMLGERDRLLEAEKTIAESRRLLELVLDTAPVRIFWKDFDSRYLGGNAAFARDAGFSSSAELAGKTDHDMVWKDYAEAYRADDRAVMDSGVAMLAFEEQAVLADGGVSWLRTSKVPLRDSNNAVIGILVVYDNITDFKRAQQNNEMLLRRNNAFMQSTREGIHILDINGDIVEANEAFCQMLGYSRDEIAKLNVADWDACWSREELRERIKKIILLDSALFETIHRRQDGSLIDVEISTTSVQVDRNRLIYALSRDITERKKNAELQRIAAVTFETQEAILITDAESNILRVNQAFQDITGYSPDEVVGCNPRMFKSGRHDAVFYKAMWSALLDTGKWSGEIWDKRKDGSIYPKLMTITAVYDDRKQITNYVAVFRDITMTKQSEQEIHQLAFYDLLTRLPNRRLLLDRLQQALAVSARNARHGALLFLDLDHFKTINDTKGHSMGDLLLIEVARRLQACVREGDSVARLGGDEFVVLLEDLSSEAADAATQAESVADKIRHELDKPYVLNNFECLSSVSIGISLFFNHLDTAEDLLKHADAAMYQAKTAGRNAIRFFDPRMQTALEARAALEADLRHALENRQFSLYYQIQVDMQRRPIGAEVLLRWKHPERGLVFPMEFIPLAEESGLIVHIGSWVLQTACAQLKEWEHDALTRGLTLAVNVSGRQFRQADFVAQVQLALRESGAQPARLKLELTESTVLENVEDTISKMHEIKTFGVSFSMDDFGTGYSSLQYLKRLPLNQIKIDRSFVRDIATDTNDAAIVQTIIAMTQTLGFDVIAEGVETEVQLEFLGSRGCHVFQGYLFSKPVPIDQFEAQIKQQTLLPLANS